VFDRETGTVIGRPLEVNTAREVDGSEAGFGRKFVAGMSTLMRTAEERKGRSEDNNNRDEKEGIVSF
jgi:hypothetical protein